MRSQTTFPGSRASDGDSARRLQRSFQFGDPDMDLFFLAALGCGASGSLGTRQLQHFVGQIEDGDAHGWMQVFTEQGNGLREEADAWSARGQRQSAGESRPFAALIGLSLGGYVAARAAGREARLGTLVVCTPLSEPAELFRPSVAAARGEVAVPGSAAKRRRATTLWKAGAAEFVERTRGVVADPVPVSLPFLSIPGEVDSSVFAAQTSRWNDSIRSVRRRLVQLDAASGADGHGQVGNRTSSSTVRQRTAGRDPGRSAGRSEAGESWRERASRPLHAGRHVAATGLGSAIALLGRLGERLSVTLADEPGGP